MIWSVRRFLSVLYPASSEYEQTTMERRGSRMRFLRLSGKIMRSHWAGKKSMKESLSRKRKIRDDVSKESEASGFKAGRL